MNGAASREPGDPVEAVAIDVVVVSLRVSPPTIARALALLDDGERAAASMREGDARRRYVVAHAAQRVLVAARLDADPARVRFESEPTGRPFTEGLAFSLSHSGDRAAVAMSEPGLELGVDLERIRSRPHLDRLARRVFAPAEYDAWRARPLRARPSAFAQRWTEIEAVLKARGTGIAGGLATARDVGPGWSCLAFDAGTGYAGAVAGNAAAIAVTTRGFRLGDALRGRDGTGC